ncbi:FAD-linked oxidoreductase-like protein [Aspergillus falconensis]
MEMSQAPRNGREVEPSNVDTEKIPENVISGIPRGCRSQSGSARSWSDKETMKRHRSTARLDVDRVQAHVPTMRETAGKHRSPPLARMPMGVLLRSLAFTTIMSTALLKPAMGFMRLMAVDDARLFSPQQNPLVRFALRSSFYKQFAAGENEAEVGKTIRQMKRQGFSGVILGYAREIVVAREGRQPESVEVLTEADLRDIEMWKQGTRRTLKMVGPGDFLAVKFTGAGRIAVDACLQGLPLPPQPIRNAMDEICHEARAQGSRIWIDAEQTAVQRTLDLWVIDLMRRHNRGSTPLVYNTVQSYLKSARENVINHLRLASKEGWTLGLKIVRGAYIANEPRGVIHDTKEDTDNNYNGIVRSLLSREYPGTDVNDNTYASLPHPPFPNMHLFVASHNVETIQKAYLLHSARMREGLPTVPLEFGQLQGMADDLSCELLSCRQADLQSPNERVRAGAPKPFKCLSWGTPTELVQNLYRRAVENTDAVQRSRNMASALRTELWRRTGGRIFGG